jgi:hypothetical protein
MKKILDFLPGEEDRVVEKVFHFTRYRGDANWHG